MDAWWFFAISLMNLLKNEDEMDDKLMIDWCCRWRENDEDLCLCVSFGGREERKENFDFFINIHIVMGFNPMWCSHFNFGELTLFLKYLIHSLIHHQLKNAYHMLKNPFMQRKMYLGSFGIQKSVGNWNPEISGTNVQNHSNWALSLYELYGNSKHA